MDINDTDRECNEPQYSLRTHIEQDSRQIIHAMYYIYHGSYELTYLNQRIRRMSWLK